MKQPVSWRRLVKGGLASMAALAAVLFLFHQIREALPPPPPEVHVLPDSGERPPEGPPMRIDPGDLARAGRERNDNELEMTFCWCPPGSFHMGRLHPVSFLAQKRLYQQDGVAVTLSHGFWMGKFELTQAQWQHVMGATLREQR